MFTLYGWHLSYFSGKARAYLRYKGIPFVDKDINAYTLFRTIPANTKAKVMPVLQTPKDEWIQDTREIIDRYAIAQT